MTFRGDDRAVTVQIGAVILLGFLVVSLSLYQATVVPDQNERVEFDHSQQVQESLQDLRNGILRTASADRTTPTTVPLGTRYPTRIVAVNPPPSGGRLATAPGGNVTLVDATAINDETADYWNGTNRSYVTQRLSYRPDYSVYQAAPRTTYANSVLYNEFDNGARALTDQRLLKGNLIYVVTLNGSYGQSGTQAVSVSPTPVSTSDRSVAVDGSDIAIQVTTDLSEDEWERLLADQYERNGGRIDGNASGVTVTGGTLTVDLVPDRTYRLRMAKVGVGTDVTDTSEKYLTVVDGASSVTAGGTRRIELEVRDGYNNPVPGVTVNASVNRSDAAISPTEAVSDGQGRVIYEYSAPDSLPSARDDSINFTFRGSADQAGFSGSEPESVQLNVTVVSLAGGGQAAGSADQIVFDTLEEADNNGRLRFQIENTGSSSVTVTRFSVSDGSTSDEIQRGSNNPELLIDEITADGEAVAPGNNGFETDGTVHDLDTEAVIGGSEFARVTLEEFESDDNRVDLVGLQQVDNESNADITVTLYFDDGNAKEFYFAF